MTSSTATSIDSTFSQGRSRPTNFIQICDTLADSYPYGMPHGVQKDAIQNSYDARTAPKKQLIMEFAIIETEQGRFFTMTDSNTVGLTGPVRYANDYEEGLDEQDHWARFEAFAFTKQNPEAIGARGQGKFIFLNASNRYQMYYDTLREDGVYRLGATRATLNNCPILPGINDEPWEGDQAEKILRNATGLDRLKQIGTRVIIVNPKDELFESIENGEFIRAIQETWFRAIQKGRANISIQIGDAKQTVSLPHPYPLPDTDTQDHKVWMLDKNFNGNVIQLKTGEKYRVKHFHAVYLNKGTVPENLRGIAIIHNDMKICTEPMNIAPPQVRDRITGFIEFDRDLDYELRKGFNQNPNHYDLNWRKRLPRAIKDYVASQLTVFGKQKLGLGTDERENRNLRRTSAERWAMQQLTTFAKDLALFGTIGVKPPPPDHPIPPSPVKPLGVIIHGFSFPEPSIAPRVNWGHTISGIEVSAFNRTPDDYHGILTLRIHHGDSILTDILGKTDLDLSSIAQDRFGPFDFVIDKSSFPEPGEYRLKAKIVDAETGDEIDSVAKRFWVEKDPPLRQPFDIQPVAELPEPNHRRQWLTSGSINSSPVLYYNTSHPAYRFAEEEGDHELGEYLLSVMLEGAINFVLDRPNTEEGDLDFRPLDANRIIGEKSSSSAEEIPKKAYDEIVKYLSEVRWRLIEGQ